NGWAKHRSHRWSQILLDTIIVLGSLAAVATGHAVELLVVFVVPTLLAVGFLGFAFDLLPHHPYDSTERFHDTRNLPSRTLNVLLLGQNYHLIHHLWNTIPWYKYQRVHVETRDDLRAIGARVDWGD
ncbi:MAG: fatty acid desaturase, partial [Gammaproteobacteria bacterium]|nr:fatty acid desaturase [Gammaproteobacteria bacterium]